jgi:hypothetical protein
MRHGKRMRLVQGPLGPLLADHAAHANRRPGGRWRRGAAKADDQLQTIPGLRAFACGVKQYGRLENNRLLGRVHTIKTKHR